MKITAMIDGKKHWFTGGVSKKLPLFTAQEELAKEYSKEEAEERIKYLDNIMDLSRLKIE